jgi:hypothetical protein
MDTVVRQRLSHYHPRMTNITANAEFKTKNYMSVRLFLIHLCSLNDTIPRLCANKLNEIITYTKLEMISAQVAMAYLK